MHRILNCNIPGYAARRCVTQAPPGLQVITNFLSGSEHDSVVSEVSRIFEEARGKGKNHHAQKVEIPQPESVKSQAHNLLSNEYYLPVQVSESAANPNKVLSCAYFQKYGDAGHELIYFSKGKLKSLPLFGQRLVREKVMAASMRDSFTLDGKWRMTLNIYMCRGSGDAQQLERPGFPLHKDLPANGDITMILSLLASCRMELVPESNLDSTPLQFELKPASLVVLSGEVRWHWLHRVLPAMGDAGIRASVVFGWKP